MAELTEHFATSSKVSAADEADMVDAILFAAHMVFGVVVVVVVVVVVSPRIDRAAAAEQKLKKCGPPRPDGALQPRPPHRPQRCEADRDGPLCFSHGHGLHGLELPKSDHNPRPALATKHRLSFSRFSPVFAPHCHLCGRHYRRNCPRPRPNWASPTPPPPSLARGPHLSDKAPLSWSPTTTGLVRLGDKCRSRS